MAKNQAAGSSDRPAWQVELSRLWEPCSRSGFEVPLPNEPLNDGADVARWVHERIERYDSPNSEPSAALGLWAIYRAVRLWFKSHGLSDDLPTIPKECDAAWEWLKYGQRKGEPPSQRDAERALKELLAAMNAKAIGQDSKPNGAGSTPVVKIENEMMTTLADLIASCVEQPKENRVTKSRSGKAGSGKKRGRKPATDEQITEACEVWIEYQQSGKGPKDFCDWRNGDKNVGRVGPKWLAAKLALVRKMKRESLERIPKRFANKLKPLRRVKRAV